MSITCTVVICTVIFGGVVISQSSLICVDHPSVITDTVIFGGVVIRQSSLICVDHPSVITDTVIFGGVVTDMFIAGIVITCMALLCWFSTLICEACAFVTEKVMVILVGSKLVPQR
jgi:hypothetical protein